MNKNFIFLLILIILTMIDGGHCQNKPDSVEWSVAIDSLDSNFITLTIDIGDISSNPVLEDIVCEVVFMKKNKIIAKKKIAINPALTKSYVKQISYFQHTTVYEMRYLHKVRGFDSVTGVNITYKRRPMGSWLNRPSSPRTNYWNGVPFRIL